MLLRPAVVLLLLAVTSAGQTAQPVAPKAARKPATKAAPAKPAGPVTAIIHTTVGDMKCQLFPDKAPKAVENFIGLSLGTKDWTDPATGKPVHHRPLYDGVTFHRVIPKFMVQTGDPMGNGMGNPGYRFEDEFSPDLQYDRPGRLGMANSGPASNGSQFFITTVPTPWLNNRHTIFGQCDDDAIALVAKIADGPCTAGPCSQAAATPVHPEKIKHIEIQGAGKGPRPSGKSTSKAKTPPK